MQTIQEVIRNLDKKCLEGRYFYKHSPKLWEFSPDDTRTIERDSAAFHASCLKGKMIVTQGYRLCRSH